MWLIEQITMEFRKYADGAGAPGEFGKVAEYALERGLALLDEGVNFDLLSAGEFDRLHDALYAKETDSVDVLWNLLDQPKDGEA
jgi:hypothetical protein